MARICKGWHYSLPMFPWVVKTDFFSRKVEFTNSCRYDLQTADQQDWNKLTGFTLGASLRDNIHQDSLRIAWRWNKKEEKVELTWYAYCNGQRLYAEAPLYKAGIGESLCITLALRPDGFYTVIVAGSTTVVCIMPQKLKSARRGWLCFPYFGGNRTAPNPITIRI